MMQGKIYKCAACIEYGLGGQVVLKGNTAFSGLMKKVIYRYPWPRPGVMY
jgi:hypothetical protein